ncbi:hypothetical protein I552_9793 [Mycobacterium xenopi 3993]|nr:hypothetical protein I552_9793 [Mycobacterium xenopi 3993]
MMLIAARPLWHVRHRRCLAESVQWSRPSGCRAQTRARALRAAELAQASVMAALCAATAIIAVVLPFGAALALLGTVPMGLLAYRYRLRVLIAAAVAAGMIAFLIAGMGGFMTVVNSAYVGA